MIQSIQPAQLLDGVTDNPLTLASIFPLKLLSRLTVQCSQGPQGPDELGANLVCVAVFPYLSHIFLPVWLRQHRSSQEQGQVPTDDRASLFVSSVGG